jgi:hypothetical protein
MASHFYLFGSSDDKWPLLKNLGGFFQKKIDSVIFTTFGKVDMEMDIAIFEKTGGLFYIFENPDSKQLVEEASSEDSPYIINGDDIKIVDRSILRKLEKVDICKVDTDAITTRMIIYELIDSGFRPGILLVRFNDSPDTNTSSQLVAGHLQNCGYSLMGVHEDKYLYYFTDNCLYDYCSWTEVGIENPLINEFKNAFIPKKKEEEEKKESC